ncbi:DnaB-like helicase N-terminal domain-containing protein [Pseudomonas aeruginosa]|nr:DnaB-like helicase N-terminal domain-containing protein [Pseudomonas aeruginosa]MDO7894907.1 DnaB-like helicase N-terminal domain-containing protein [Pseudomonas aeruginosa]
MGSLSGDQLQKEDFFRHEHRLIFTAISELAAKMLRLMS